MPLHARLVVAAAVVMVWLALAALAVRPQIYFGAPEVGERALLRFYVLHVYVLPALLTMLLAVHVWRVRKDGFAGGEPVAEPRAAVAEPDREGAGDGR